MTTYNKTINVIVPEGVTNVNLGLNLAITNGGGGGGATGIAAIPSLLAWWDATDTSTLVVGGSNNITSWTSKGPNNWAMTPLSGTPNWNGTDAVDFANNSLRASDAQWTGSDIYVSVLGMSINYAGLTNGRVLTATPATGNEDSDPQGCVFAQRSGSASALRVDRVNQIATVTTPSNTRLVFTSSMLAASVSAQLNNDTPVASTGTVDLADWNVISLAMGASVSRGEHRFTGEICQAVLLKNPDVGDVAAAKAYVAELSGVTL